MDNWAESYTNARDIRALMWCHVYKTSQSFCLNVAEIIRKFGAHHHSWLVDFFKLLQIFISHGILQNTVFDIKLKHHRSNQISSNSKESPKLTEKLLRLENLIKMKQLVGKKTG